MKSLSKGSSRRKAVVIVVALVTMLAGTALAISNIVFKLGTIASYDFGAYGPGYPVAGTVQIHGFKIQPGENIPWHYHKGLSYVILSRGTLTEQHLIGPDQCASEELKGGSAFVETPGLVHNVTNTGSDTAIVWWATVYPQSDGPGGIYPANAPNCN